MSLILSGLVVLHLIDIGSLFVEFQNQFAISCTIALPEALLYRLSESETVEIGSTKTIVTPFARHMRWINPHNLSTLDSCLLSPSPTKVLFHGCTLHCLDDGKLVLSEFAFLEKTVFAPGSVDTSLEILPVLIAASKGFAVVHRVKLDVSVFHHSSTPHEDDLLTVRILSQEAL